MFRRKPKENITISMSVTASKDAPVVFKTYEWEGLILPVIGPKGGRFIILDTHRYPWRFIIIDTKHNVEVHNNHHMSELLAVPAVQSLNQFAADGCTFPWEPKNV